MDFDTITAGYYTDGFMYFFNNNAYKFITTYTVECLRCGKVSLLNGYLDEIYYKQEATQCCECTQ